MFGRHYFGGSWYGPKYYGDGGSGTPSGATAAQIWAYVLPNGKSAGVNLAEINNVLTGAVEGTFDFTESLRILLAVAAGKTRITDNGNGTAHVEFDAAGGADLRVAAEMTGSERTGVTLTP